MLNSVSKEDFQRLNDVGYFEWQSATGSDFGDGIYQYATCVPDGVCATLIVTNPSHFDIRYHGDSLAANLSSMNSCIYKFGSCEMTVACNTDCAEGSSPFSFDATTGFDGNETSFFLYDIDSWNRTQGE